MKKLLSLKYKVQSTKYNLKKSHPSIVSFFLWAFVFYLLPSFSSAQQWYQASFGGNTLYDICFTSPDTGYVVGAAGTIRKTTDAGNTWTTLSSGTSEYLWSVFFVDADTGYVAGENATILKTTDAGANWTALNSGLILGDHLTSIFFTDAYTGYAAGGFGYIRKTTDAGATWNAQSSGTTSNLESIYFVDANTGYAVGAAGTIRTTSNGGSFWSTHTSGTNDLLYSVYFTGPSTGYTVGLNGTIRNYTGSVWTAQTSGTANYLLDVSFIGATGYAAGGSGTLLKTINSGSTWFALSSGTTEDLWAVYFTDATTGYAIGSNGIILKTCNIAANAGNDTTICSGTSASIGGTPAATGGTAPYSYSWAPSNSLSASNVENPVATPGSYTVYSLTVTDNNSCTATDSMNMYVAASPTAAIPSVSHVSCNGGNNGIVSATANGGVSPYTFTWSNGNTGPNVAGLVAGTYILTITGGNACIDTESVTITEPPAINISISQTNVTCNGGSDGTATATVSGGTPVYTYTWTSGFTTIGTAASISGLTGGNYTINVTDANNCNASANVTITETPVFSGGISSTDVSCFGGNNGTATANGTGGTTPYSFLWFNGFTAPTISNLATGTYSVTISDANGCGNLQYSATINQPTSPISATTSSSDVTCNGGNDGSVTANPSGGIAPYSYLWSNGVQTQSIASLQEGNYSVTVTDSNGCTATDSVVVNAPPATVVNAGIDFTFCANNSAISLNGNVSGTTTTGIWSTNGTGTFSPNTTDLTATYFPSNADLISGMVEILLTSTNNGACNAETDTVVYTFSPAPSVNAGTDQSVCEENPDVSLSGSISGGTTTGMWITSGTGSFSPNNTDLNAVYIPSQSDIISGNIFLVLASTNNGNCFSEKDTVIITYFLSPVADAGADENICFGSTAFVTATGGITYLWSSGATSASTSLSPSVTSDYGVTVTDANGCSAIDSLIIFVNAMPVADFAAMDVCLGATTTFTDISSISSGNIVSYEWDFGDGTVSFLQNPSHLYFSDGFYNVSLIVVSDSGCNDTILKTAIVFSSPVADAGTDQSMCIGDSAQLNASGGITYSWTPASNLSDPNIANPFSFPTDTTNYIVTIQDANGCSASDSVTVFVNPLPNANAGNDTTISQGGTAMLTASGGINYLWNNTEVTATISVSPNSTANYSVTVTDANGCSNSDSVTVFVIQTNFSIYGTIYDQTLSFSLNNGTVYLLQYSSGVIQTTADSFLLGGINGDYVFNNHPAGQYLILFRPDNSVYPDAIPTYYGDTISWSGAQIINLISDTSGIDISTREVPQLSGNGFISGFIQFGTGSGKSNGSIMPLGDPVPGVDISIEQIPGGIVKHTTTDNTGFYSFSNLPTNNSKYRLLVDIPGLPMDSTYTVTLSDNDTVYNNLDYVVDTSSGAAGIYIGYPLGIKSQPDRYRVSNPQSPISIYPNPFNTFIKFEYELSERADVKIEMYNLLGERIFFSDKKRLPEGKYAERVEMEETNSGIYFVKFSIGERVYSHRIIRMQ